MSGISCEMANVKRQTSCERVALDAYGLLFNTDQKPSAFTIDLAFDVLDIAARLEQNGTYRACSPTGPVRVQRLPRVQASLFIQAGGQPCAH